MRTRGELMLALRKSRMAASPPVLRGGFRPFFLLGACWAVISLALWLMALADALVLPTAFDALTWHRHEMLFGFVGAIISGFLLTAIPNWTGRLPIAGMPLAALVGIWIAARLGVLFSATIGLVAAAVLDVGFYLLLGGLAAREVLAANNRNVPVLGLLFLFAIANAADHLAVAGFLGDGDLAWKFAVALVTLMISLIGGRIIPSFTRNWLAKQGARGGMPTQPSRFDVGVIIVTGLALLAWLTAPPGWLTGGLLLISAAAQALRLARWKGWRTLSDPLVVILHVGYAWVPLGLALLGAVEIGAAIPRSAAVHALTAGAMATMILAVMSRATLGHTGRELRANGITVVCYALVTLGAVLRVAAPLDLIEYRFGMELAGAAWIGAFLLFLAAYGPMLFQRRIGKES